MSHSKELSTVIQWGKYEYWRLISKEWTNDREQKLWDWFFEKNPKPADWIVARDMTRDEMSQVLAKIRREGARGWRTG